MERHSSRIGALCLKNNRDYSRLKYILAILFNGILKLFLLWVYPNYYNMIAPICEKRKFKKKIWRMHPIKLFQLSKSIIWKLLEEAQQICFRRECSIASQFYIKEAQHIISSWLKHRFHYMGEIFNSVLKSDFHEIEDFCKTKLFHGLVRKKC